MYEFKIFAEINFFNIERNKYKQIINEIKSKSDDYILQVNEEEYITYLIEKYTFKLLSFDFDNKFIEENNNKITCYLPFKGDQELLRYKPDLYRFGSKKVFIKANYICFNINYINNPNQMSREIENILQNIKIQYSNLEKNIETYNSSLYPKISAAFKVKKEEILQKNKNIEAIGIPLRRRNDAQTYAVSVPKQKKIIPFEPKVTKNNILYPTISYEDYNYILKLIYDGCQVFERLPSTYTNKNEETLRDHIILFLTPHFEGSVTGETFNKSGKTDILLRYNNSNVFVAECKFWKGKKSYHDAITQLLSYLTCRDSKTALILFVKNKEITLVIDKIKEETQNHENYIKTNTQSNEFWLNYTFHLNGDTNLEIKLAILIFHIPEN